MAKNTLRACRKKPFGWNTRKVARSPLKTLARAKQAEKDFYAGKSIGFTARSSLKSMGRLARAGANRCYMLGAKYAH